MEEMRNAYRISIPKPERKRSFGRPTCRREDNIRKDLRESEKLWPGCIWIGIENTVMNFLVP
jgi:hypothetical protein